MKSKDMITQEMKARFETALKSEDEDALPQAMADLAASIHDSVMEDAKEFQRTQDESVLTKRGCHVLTADETKFYSTLAQSVTAGDIKSAFDTAGLTPAFPETVIDTVLDDIGTTFPLLGAINVQNTSTLTKMIVNKQGEQLATWDALGTEIKTKLEGAIGKIELGTNKLTAYMVVSKDMLDAGPMWVDAYIRAVLVEALGGGLCKSIIAGTGNNQPIGMIKDVSDGVTVTGGVYPDKATTAIAELSPDTIGGIAKTIATGPNSRQRAVPELLMVVSPADYFGKIMPATTFLTPAGAYVNNILPYPTKIVQDANVPANRAIFGLASRYFMGVGKGGSGGKIEYSDDVHFIEDERVYITKLYGNGKPLDNNAFVVADITNLAPLSKEVVVKEVKGVVTTKAQA